MRYKTFNILFIFILILPNVGYFLDIDQTKTKEKRDKITLDSIKLTNYKAFTKSFESYVNDNFEYRNLMLSTNSKLRYNLFRTNINDKVIVGKDNWLFLNKIGQDNAYDDYTHRNLLTNSEISGIKQTITKRFNYLKSKGIGYYPIVYPNPHSIYSNKLPFSVNMGIKGDVSRCEQVINATNDSKKGIEILNPTEYLLDQKDRYLLYLKNDTHWNEMGAYFTYKYLFTEISKDFPQLKPKELSQFDVYWIESLDDPLLDELDESNNIFDGYKYKGQKNAYCPNGLENLLAINTSNVIRDSLPILIDKEPFTAIKVTEKGKNKTAPSLIVCRNQAVKHGLTALVYRDSYTDALQKFLIPHFSKIILTRSHFNKMQIEQHNVDLVIEGRVERYFPNHFKY